MPSEGVSSVKPRRECGGGQQAAWDLKSIRHPAGEIFIHPSQAHHIFISTALRISGRCRFFGISSWAWKSRCRCRPGPGSVWVEENNQQIMMIMK
eukprot:g11759.t1